MNQPSTAQDSAADMSADGTEPGGYLGYAPEVDTRLNTLLRDIGEHIGRLYRGENIASPEAIPLLSRAFQLAEAACGFSSLSTVEDVLDAIDEAI